MGKTRARRNRKSKARRVVGTDRSPPAATSTVLELELTHKTSLVKCRNRCLGCLWIGKGAKLSAHEAACTVSLRNAISDKHAMFIMEIVTDFDKVLGIHGIPPLHEILKRRVRELRTVNHEMNEEIVGRYLTDEYEPDAFLFPVRVLWKDKIGPDLSEVEAHTTNYLLQLARLGERGITGLAAAVRADFSSLQAYPSALPIHQVISDVSFVEFWMRQFTVPGPEAEDRFFIDSVEDDGKARGGSEWSFLPTGSFLDVDDGYGFQISRIMWPVDVELLVLIWPAIPANTATARGLRKLLRQRLKGLSCGEARHGSLKAAAISIFQKYAVEMRQVRICAIDCNSAIMLPAGFSFAGVVTRGGCLGWMRWVMFADLPLLVNNLKSWVFGNGKGYRKASDGVKEVVCEHFGIILNMIDWMLAKKNSSSRLVQMKSEAAFVYMSLSELKKTGLVDGLSDDIPRDWFGQKVESIEEAVRQLGLGEHLESVWGVDGSNHDCSDSAQDAMKLHRFMHDEQNRKDMLLKFIRDEGYDIESDTDNEG